MEHREGALNEMEMVDQKWLPRRETSPNSFKQEEHKGKHHMQKYEIL